ncbi:MAG: dihydroorotate dehydrogenase-like protein [Phycisphaerae bacterium]|nr:dihydroorotate dehydrogenase-like protein [Phycisphaerae bacterium]
MDLSTTYMGLQLSSPLVAGSSPLSFEVDNIRRMEQAGAAAVVLHSLFEEQITHDAAELEFFLHYGADRFAESLTYYPRQEAYELGPEEYLTHIVRAKRAVTIPIIASLNGVSAGGWISYAKKMEEAGADALELNVYYIPTDSRLTAEQVESVYLMVLRAVKHTVGIPVAMKLSPYFSSIANMLTRLADDGADALVLFNRFLQPDLDIERLEVDPALGPSTSADIRPALRWIAILRDQLRCSLAATNGVHTSDDVVKLLLAGADVTMLASTLLRNGIGHLTHIRRGLETYMSDKGYASLGQMRGILSQKHVAEPAAFERANYVKTLQHYGPTATRE